MIAERLFPPDLREWVVGDDMVHFVIEAVGGSRKGHVCHGVLHQPMVRYGQNPENQVRQTAKAGWLLDLGPRRGQPTGCCLPMRSTMVVGPIWSAKWQAARCSAEAPWCGAMGGATVRQMSSHRGQRG